MRALLGCAVLGLSLFAGTACGGPAASCETAGRPLLDMIAKGAKVSALEVTAGKTLKSPDHGGMYLLAATAKSGGTDRVGVWATSNLDGEAQILAVDTVAKEVTSYGDAAMAQSISPSSGGVADVRACL